MSKILFSIVMIGLLLVSVSTVEAQQKKPRLVSNASVHEKAITFQTASEYGAIQMSVSGPYEWQYHQTLKGGQEAELPAQTKSGFKLPDGLYKVDFIAQPKVDEVRRSQLRQAREKGDYNRVVELNMGMKKMGLKKPETHSATFRITGGKFVDPSKKEESNSKKESTEKGRGWMISPDRLYDAESDYTSTGHYASAARSDDRIGARVGAKVRDRGSARKARVGFVPDQVFNDDVIVDGSLCVGFDCVNGESFGFDTIRMKENNTRLHFLDTSVAASFPRNDWSLEANDSSNGGSNHMAIVDRTSGRDVFKVEAGAPSNSLFVDDAGRIGLGTSTPAVEIHTRDGDTPTLRLDQDGSFGWSPQIWDVAGNETNFFVRDVTNGSQLPLRIRPGAPTSSIDIQSDGSVRFGAGGSMRALVTPDGQLRAKDGDGDNPGLSFIDAPGTGLWRNGTQDLLFIGVDSIEVARFFEGRIQMKSGTAAKPTYAFKSATTTGIFRPGVGEIGFTLSGTEAMRITGTGVGIGVTAPTEQLEVAGNALATAHTTPSDARLKTNVKTLETALATVLALRGVRFEWNDTGKSSGHPTGPQVGVIAQEILEVLPEAVSGSEDKYYSVAYSNIVPVLIEAIKEQQRRIEMLEKRILN